MILFLAVFSVQKFTAINVWTLKPLVFRFQIASLFYLSECSCKLQIPWALSTDDNLVRLTYGQIWNCILMHANHVNSQICILDSYVELWNQIWIFILNCSCVSICIILFAIANNCRGLTNLKVIATFYVWSESPFDSIFSICSVKFEVFYTQLLGPKSFFHPVSGQTLLPQMEWQVISPR